VKQKRLFVGLDLPESVRQSLSALDPHLHGVRWMKPEQIHLTLCFLGNVETAAEEILREKLAAIRMARFFLPLQGMGSFPARGQPQVIWIGVGAGHPQLFYLHKRVQDAALAAGLEPDLRPWHPHITIARCKHVAAESVRPFLKKHADFDGGLVRVNSFALYSSEPRESGSIYTRELTVTG
jgi:RNA 2',3'-cyclic 3'-phosphodiesterase